MFAWNDHLLIRLICIQDQCLEEPDTFDDRSGSGVFIDGVDTCRVFVGPVAESVRDEEGSKSKFGKTAEGQSVLDEPVDISGKTPVCGQ